jgi:hypothetical protein
MPAGAAECALFGSAPANVVASAVACARSRRGAGNRYQAVDTSCVAGMPRVQFVTEW